MSFVSVGLKTNFESCFTAAEHFQWQQMTFPVCFAFSATVSIGRRVVIQVTFLQVIQKTNHLDEALARMESHQANQQFKAIKKWRARHQNSVQREGGFLMFCQKKMASVKAQITGGEIKNGRDPATLQVTWKQLNWLSPLKKLHNSVIFLFFYFLF